ncbi:nickel pincer cofactor biosynthesis protein LarC [Geovibrio thiophilus]|uniref:Putative nickel insertion protein n=1 Tax=Geovibrio thiophilus TaxID=139438 RepID=A0A410JZF4_9BACT|nr:nickel pincer cofactor biosynthesis protein LarC [Geovibrio thiophilus]QAR33519.1 nickel pincer cofactor biosynthesis protein LarC [Geovibrio thiophilus]
MKILYYDCFSGISGDMNLAAMIDLGVSADYLRTELAKLGLGDEFEVKTSGDMRKGISGTRVDVALKHHHHDHSHGHHHRNLKDIETVINSSALEDKVKKTALDIFLKVAEAEAKVHGKGLYEVHFHEVGATDSIVDIVGAAICFHALGVDEVRSSAVELGGGMVKCAHGLMPVPAPATAEILKGVPVTLGKVNKETTTPTGAAILAALTDKFCDVSGFAIQKTGYGIGHNDNEVPNVLRVFLAEAENYVKTGQAVLLQCNIDDMTPEMLGAAMELLMDEGASDVHFTPIIMKKNRPAVTISVLCPDEDADRFRRLLFLHTSTLGIKSTLIRKDMLEVSFDKLDTPLGTVTMKNAVMDGKIIRSKPEFEDCKKLSEQHGIPLSEVYTQIWKCGK